MDDNRPKRKEVLSLARTQLKLVAVVCVPLVIACLAVSFLQTFFFLTSVSGPGAFSSDFAREIIPTACWITVIVLAVLLGACFFVSILVGHRLVGPMRRLAAEAQAIANGKIGKGFHMREGDDLVFVADAVSTMQASLTDRIAKCREACERIQRTAQRVESEAGGSEYVRKLLAELNDASTDLSEQLGAFELADDPGAETTDGESADGQTPEEVSACCK